MIRKGIPNRTVTSSTFESGYRLDPMRSGITRDIRLPPKKGQARNYAMFLESPTNYTYYDVRRQYDWKTDRAYMRKETPKEAIARAREEYIKAVEQARGEPITIPYIEKIEKLALLDSLQKINLPEDQKGLLIEKFMDLENKLADIKLPDSIKQQIRASAYNQFLVSQSITPVQLIDPDTGKPSKLSITMAGASDLGDGDPSVIKMTEMNTEDLIKYLQQQKGKKGKPKVESSDLAGASLADQIQMEQQQDGSAQVLRDQFFENLKSLSDKTLSLYREYDFEDFPEGWVAVKDEIARRQQSSGAGLGLQGDSPSIFKDQPSIETFGEDDAQYSQAYEYFSQLSPEDFEKYDVRSLETADARSAYRAYLDVVNMRQSMEREATSLLDELNRQPKPSRAEGEEKKPEEKKEEKKLSKQDAEKQVNFDRLKAKYTTDKLRKMLDALPSSYKKSQSQIPKRGGSEAVIKLRNLSKEVEGMTPDDILRALIYARKQNMI